jgi:hypothetical protein
MRKVLLLAATCLALAAPASAQLTVPYSFSSGQVASPTEVNANFAKFADALNRTGGTMTGTLTSRSVVPSASNTYDLGSSSFFFQSAYLKTSMVFGQTAGNYTLTWANPAAARAVSIEDPGGTDIFVWKAATQTLTNKTLTAPVLGGSVTGTYTLAGTPTITSPTISNPVLSGTVTGTYTLGGTPSIVGTALTGTTLASNIVTSSLTTVGTIASGTWSGSFGAVSGANLTNLTAANLSGTIASAVQDNITRTGTVTSGTWSGSFGAVSGANLTTLNASNISSGSLADARLSANVPLINATNTFSGSTPIVLGATSKGQLRTDQAGYFTMQGGTTGYAWQNNANSSALMILTDGGALTVNGFGTHSFTSGGAGNQALLVTNTTSGTTNAALVRTTAGTTIGQLTAYSQGYTTGTYDVQASTSLTSNGAGGISIAATDASGDIRFYARGSTTPQLTIGNGGVLDYSPTTAQVNASNTLTMTNAPVAYSGNPAGYVVIKIGGVSHVIPYW